MSREHQSEPARSPKRKTDENQSEKNKEERAARESATRSKPAAKERKRKAPRRRPSKEGCRPKATKSTQQPRLPGSLNAAKRVTQRTPRMSDRYWTQQGISAPSAGGAAYAGDWSTANWKAEQVTAMARLAVLLPEGGGPSEHTKVGMSARTARTEAPSRRNDPAGEPRLERRHADQRRQVVIAGTGSSVASSACGRVLLACSRARTKDQHVKLR